MLAVTPMPTMPASTRLPPAFVFWHVYDESDLRERGGKIARGSPHLQEAGGGTGEEDQLGRRTVRLGVSRIMFLYMARADLLRLQVNPPPALVQRGKKRARLGIATLQLFSISISRLPPSLRLWCPRYCCTVYVGLTLLVCWCAGSVSPGRYLDHDMPEANLIYFFFFRVGLVSLRFRKTFHRTDVRVRGHSGWLQLQHGAQAHPQPQVRAQLRRQRQAGINCLLRFCFSQGKGRERGEGMAHEVFFLQTVGL